MIELEDNSRFFSYFHYVAACNTQVANAWDSNQLGGHQTHFRRRR